MKHRLASVSSLFAHQGHILQPSFKPTTRTTLRVWTPSEQLIHAGWHGAETVGPAEAESKSPEGLPQILGGLEEGAWVDLWAGLGMP